jgi:hypothetical protein
VEVNRPEIVAEVQEVFLRYESALVANDVVVLTALFWDGPLVVRYGTDEALYGSAEIERFRLGRDPGDGTRELVRTVITTFGRDFATTCAEFRRTRSGQAGRQTQSWVRTEEGWRIVAAHVSLV